MNKTSKFLKNIGFNKAEDNADNALSFWLALKDMSNNIPEPLVGVGVEGEILISWDLEGKYIESDFRNENEIEVFYEKKRINETFNKFDKCIKNGHIDFENFSKCKKAAQWVHNKIKKR